MWHAEKLKDPLLIYTNTSDDDVNVVEVESMIRALKAEGKKFVESKNMPTFATENKKQ